MCSSRGLASDPYCPVVTTALKQMITSFNFAGVGSEDLGTGCNPFQVAYAGSQDYYAAQTVAGVVQQLEQGASNANLSDIQTIKDKEKVRFPSDMHQVGITLQRYAVLVQTLFQGTTAAVHPFVRAMWELATGFQTRLPFIMDRYQGLGPGSPLHSVYPAHIIRTIQINAHEYLQRIGASYDGDFRAVDDIPNFSQLLQDLQRGTFHTSNGWVPLPAEYVVANASVRMGSAASLAGTVSTAPLTTIGAAGGATSVMSAITAHTSTATAAARGQTQTRQQNDAPDPEFSAMTLRSGLGQLLRTNRPPRNDAGHEFCVAWWCKGGCYTACGRRAAHVPFASGAERTRLWDFAREHLARPAA